MNPNGLVPALVDDEGDGEPLWETGAILRYVADRHGGGAFWPKDAVRRAQVDRWAEWVKVTAAPRFTEPVFRRVVRTAPHARDWPAIRAAVAAYGRVLDVAEARLDGRPPGRRRLHPGGRPVRPRTPPRPRAGDRPAEPPGGAELLRSADGAPGLPRAHRGVLRGPARGLTGTRLERRTAGSFGRGSGVGRSRRGARRVLPERCGPEVVGGRRRGTLSASPTAPPLRSRWFVLDIPKTDRLRACLNSALHQK